jgi:hypothetical protein
VPATKDPVKDVLYSMGHDLTCWQFTFPLKMFSRDVVRGLHVEIRRSVRQGFRRVVFPMGIGYAVDEHVSNSKLLATVANRRQHANLMERLLLGRSLSRLQGGKDDRCYCELMSAGSSHRAKMVCFSGVHSGQLLLV